MGVALPLLAALDVAVAVASWGVGVPSMVTLGKPLPVPPRASEAEWVAEEVTVPTTTVKVGVGDRLATEDTENVVVGKCEKEVVTKGVGVSVGAEAEGLMVMTGEGVACRVWAADREAVALWVGGEVEEPVMDPSKLSVEAYVEVVVLSTVGVTKGVTLPPPTVVALAGGEMEAKVAEELRVAWKEGTGEMVVDGEPEEEGVSTCDTEGTREGVAGTLRVAPAPMEGVVLGEAGLGV